MADKNWTISMTAGVADLCPCVKIIDEILTDDLKRANMQRIRKCCLNHVKYQQKAV
ncbi:hypothetical protein [Acinetobacter wanghuae]|uniref:Uncharacterized protein n=1 Tax=Acinetobacter wanghuae TaxID=2662362 RepID=A0AA90W4M4_9GAMM|nr:hypothetical protein [Acinetobacter wanghuae]MQW92795.1 hypothetical protein [Acinetobacter wanghuae]